MTVWVLIVVAFLSTGGVKDSHVYVDKLSCKAAEHTVIDYLIKQNAQSIGTSCVELKMGQPD